MDEAIQASVAWGGIGHPCADEFIRGYLDRKADRPSDSSGVVGGNAGPGLAYDAGYEAGA